MHAHTIYKISTKIELMIFNQGQTKKFKKIGFLALDSNERSNFQARELKSVYIDNNCQKLKIVLNKCHMQHLMRKIGKQTTTYFRTLQDML